ncbi:hypothetical protein LCGC14_1521540 [marine sediment metagenome]|uniref:Uncharacterized protein n=1 Tax=marine sediment metagenome TaxID=412755 RepID=A0A0F9JJE9_9ZZZZ
MKINIIVNGRLYEEEFENPITVKEAVYAVDAVEDSCFLTTDNSRIWIRGCVPYLNGEIAGGDVELKEGETLMLAPAEVPEDM